MHIELSRCDSVRLIGLLGRLDCREMEADSGGGGGAEVIGSWIYQANTMHWTNFR